MTGTKTTTYLPAGLPAPRLDASEGAAYWSGLAQRRLLVQRCSSCGVWQAGSECICHACLAFDPVWTEVTTRGRVYSWQRVWQASHPALRERVPYLVVLVELFDAQPVRMVGNLLGDPLQRVRIGMTVHGVFEMHGRGDEAYGLLQWRCAKEAA